MTPDKQPVVDHIAGSIPPRGKAVEPAKSNQRMMICTAVHGGHIWNAN
jgi:hypothetical protein